MKVGKKLLVSLLTFFVLLSFKGIVTYAKVGDRATPFSAKINHTISLQNYMWDKPKIVQLQLLEIINGSNANSIVAGENQFNKKPTSDEEWILMKFRYKYVSGPEEELDANSIIWSGNGFFTSNGVSISPISTAVFSGSRKGYSQYDISLYPGSESVVWYGILVKKSVGGYPLIRIGTGYDSSSYQTQYSWFSTNPSYSETNSITSITLDKSNLSLIINGSYQLKASINPDNAANKNLKWTSSNTSVATVTSSGFVQAIAPGTTTITAKAMDSSGKYSNCTVIVTSPISISSMVLKNATVVKGNSINLSANINPVNASNKKLNWISTNPFVATVDVTGAIKGIAPGTVNIIAFSTDGSGKYAICSIAVSNPVSISSINLVNTSVKRGTSVRLTPIIAPSNSLNKKLTWISSNPAIATVDSDGIVKGVKTGTASIFAISTDGSGKYTSCSITVN